jgi:hypothetical protein
VASASSLGLMISSLPLRFLGFKSGSSDGAAGHGLEFVPFSAPTRGAS